MDIERIYYINLAKDRERRELLGSRLERFFPGIPAVKVDAVSPATLHLHEAFFKDRLALHLQPVDGAYPRPGAIAAFVSHYLALQMISQSWAGAGSDPNRAFLLLEDDCVFDQSVLPFIRTQIDDFLPWDWQLIKHSWGRSVRKNRVNPLFYDVNRPHSSDHRFFMGAHFLIYRVGALAGILTKMESKTVAEPDGWLKSYVEGAYSIAVPLHIKQSNLGGSNTNPDFSGALWEDRYAGFRLWPRYANYEAIANLVLRCGHRLRGIWRNG